MRGEKEESRNTRVWNFYLYIYSMVQCSFKSSLVHLLEEENNRPSWALNAD